MKFAIFNPHAFVKITSFEALGISNVNFDNGSSKSDVFYKSNDLNKVMPSDPTSVHWYSTSDFEKLVYLQSRQNDMPIGEYVLEAAKCSISANLVAELDGEKVADKFVVYKLLGGEDEG